MKLDRAAVRRALERGPALLNRTFGGDALPAAVAIPIAFDPEPTVTAVLRASNLRDHAGEVGFPGGKHETSDVDLRATALRELEEEVALADVEVLGTLSTVPVITGRYLIHPFVVATERPPFIASPEIAALLPVPLSPWLLGERTIGAVRGPWRGFEIVSPHFALSHEGREVVLYGASAFMLFELLVRLAGELGLPPPRPVEGPDLPWGDRYGG